MDLLYSLTLLVALAAATRGLSAGLGLVPNITADRQFQRHRTTVRPFEASSALWRPDS